MKNGPKISVIILKGGKLDEHLYKKCLDSVSWAYEKVIVDTAKVKGKFRQWRNFGAKKAKGDWLLYIDTDEEVTPLLKKEIIDATNNGDFAAYAIPRKNIFLGKEMHWGGWQPDFVLRLIKKNTFREWVGELHEQPVVNGKIGHLKERLTHYSHRNLSDMVDKTNEWSEIEAKLLYDSGHPPMNILRFFSAGAREFWYRGIIKLGFLDGTVGIIEVIYQTFSKLITYSKLWELQLKQE